MVERKATLGQKFRANAGRAFRSSLRSFAEIPFDFRTLRAPRGKLVRGEKTIAKGKIVRYSGEQYVIVTDENIMVFPNTRKEPNTRIVDELIPLGEE